MILRTPWQARDVEHEAVDLLGRLREQHGRAARRRIRLEDLDPRVEVVEAALANRACGVARALEVVELDDRRLARGNELGLELDEVLLQELVAEALVRPLLEVHRRDLHQRSVPPARTSATCRTRVV
jgi:hypothetical protein